MLARLWNLSIGRFRKHPWELLQRIDLMDGSRATMAHGTKWILRCRECGQIKRKRT